MRPIKVKVDECTYSLDYFLGRLREELGKLIYETYLQDTYSDPAKLLEDLRLLEECAPIEENNGVVISIIGDPNLICQITFFKLLPSRSATKLPKSGFVIGSLKESVDLEMIGEESTFNATTDLQEEYVVTADKFRIDDEDILGLESKEKPEHTGGSVSYYKVLVKQPIDTAQASYVAECLDVSIALNLTPEEFNIFKAIWRTAAERTLGLAKEGNNAKYDAEKIKFFADVNLRRYT